MRAPGVRSPSSVGSSGTSWLQRRRARARPRSCQPDSRCRASPTPGRRTHPPTGWSAPPGRCLGWRRGLRPRDRREPAAGRPGRAAGRVDHVAAVPRRTGDGDRARDARQRRSLGGLAGRHRAGPRTLRGRRPRSPPAGDDRRGDRGPLRGFLQRHAVAALPRPGGQAGVPPRVVGLLRRGEPAVRGHGRRAGQRGRSGLGARLPDAAGPPDAARAPPRPADRLLPAHPVPTGRAVPAAAVATAAARGAARRRPGRVPDARRRRELRAPRAPAGRTQDPPRPRLPARRPDGARRGVPDLHRRPGLRGARPDSRGDRPGQGDPQRAGRPAQDLPRAWTGSTTPRASTPGSARTPS